jgi:hypothetical protein
MDVACPDTHEKLFWYAQRRMKDFTHIPHLIVKGYLNSSERFCGSFSHGGDP